jgi:hypothetical protein
MGARKPLLRVLREVIRAISRRPVVVAHEHKIIGKGFLIA